MLITITFKINKETVDTINAMDMHPEDKLDLMNDAAIEEDDRVDVFHIKDEYQNEIYSALYNVFLMSAVVTPPKEITDIDENFDEDPAHLSTPRPDGTE